MATWTLIPSSIDEDRGRVTVTARRSDGNTHVLTDALIDTPQDRLKILNTIKALDTQRVIDEAARVGFLSDLISTGESNLNEWETTR